VIHLLPDLKWRELKRTVKNKTVVQVNYAISRLKFIGKVLFVQTTPSPFPFLQFIDSDKEEIGRLIAKVAKENNIGVKK